MLKNYTRDSARIVHGDVLEWAALYNGPKFHALLADPPYLDSFMGKDWDKAPKLYIPVDELPFRYWLAGFIAGEGFFRIKTAKSGSYYGCCFGIHMRADERPILTALCHKLGIGRISEAKAYVSKQGIRSAPSISWLVETRNDCLKLANVLDGIPMYAKKQREYDLWRQALDLWVSTPRGNRWHPRDNTPMENLWLEMKKLRPFDFDLPTSSFDPINTPEYLFHYKYAKAIFPHLLPGAFGMVFASARGYHRVACAIEDAGYRLYQTIFGWNYGSGFPKASRVKDNEDFNGYRYGGQFLKPALEPIIVFQKPYDGKPLDSIVKHGSGALNIDDARIKYEVGGDLASNPSLRSHITGGNGGNIISHEENRRIVIPDQQGRWPANFYVDEEAAKCLDKQSGISKSGIQTSPIADGGIWSRRSNTPCGPQYGDLGGASRFFFNVESQIDEADPVFYCAKTSKKERNAGLTSQASKELKVFGNFQGTETHTKKINVQSQNTHPTLKPLSLCKWLATLLLPPDMYNPRRLLVPFSGTSSEMIGALQSGWERVLGIEQELEYIKIAKKRISYWIPKKE